MPQRPPIMIWRYVDGKPGHDNQSLGLARALAVRRPVILHTLAACRSEHYLRGWLRGHYDRGESLPAPDLILGAGHATHLPMLTSRWRRGGRVVVLMRPSLPLRWFDLCILPAHDRPRRPPANLLITKGVLNTIRPTRPLSPQHGLILIGGPSPHFQWQEEVILQQLTTLLQRSPEIRWQLTTSRRTPPEFLPAVQQRLSGSALALIPHQQTSREWLPQQLTQCGQVWVTIDSVSMIYEALTAGGQVGLLTLPLLHRGNRVTSSLQQLIAEGCFLPPLSQPPPGPATAQHATAAAPLDEATRCAAWIDQQWLARD